MSYIGGALGVIVRPGGSSLLGLTLGILAGAMLVNAGGTTGLWAREIGYQTAQFANRRPAEAIRAARAKVAVWRESSSPAVAAAATELREGITKIWDAPKVTAMRTRAVDAFSAWWSTLLAWAASIGLSARLSQLWAFLRLGEWLSYTNARILERRQKQQRRQQ